MTRRITATTRFVWVGISLFAVLVLTACAGLGGVIDDDLAAEAEVQPVVGPDAALGPDEALTETTADEIQTPNAIKATDLVGYPVVTQAGESLGVVQDAFVLLAAGQVQYLVVSAGELLALLGADRLIPIPWQSFSLDAEDEVLVLDRTLEQLSGVPSFVSSEWPDTTDPNWDAEYLDYWLREGTVVVQATPVQTPAAETIVAGTEPVTATAATTSTSTSVATVTTTVAGNADVPESLPLSALLDFSVQTPAGEALGEVEDMLVSWQDGTIKYVVLSFGGFLGVGDKWFALPWGTLTLDPVLEVFTIDLQRKLLERAPGFDRNQWPDISLPGWDQDVRQFWVSS